MSVPARKAASSPPIPERVARPARRPAARPRPSPPPQPRPRARRGFHRGFWIFSAAVVSCLLIGIVALNALLVQTQYSMRSVQQSATVQQAEHETLVNEVARLSSPARVAAWAHGEGMVTPKDVVILRVPGTGTPSETSPGGPGG